MATTDSDLSLTGDRLEFKKKDEIRKTKKFEKMLQVFISASSKNPHDELPGTGDIDYMQTVCNGVNNETPFEAIPIQGMHDEREIFAFINAKKNSTQPLLHLHLNFPGTGTVFSLEGLKAFKARGGKLVITAIEFSKYSSSSGYKKTILQYFELAESILFLDETDKQDAIENFSKLALYDSIDRKEISDRTVGRVSTHITENKKLHEKLKQSQIVQLMPTIPTVPGHRLGQNIISFGMIREGKGFAHLIKFAKLLKKSKDALLSGKKIMILGTVQAHPDSKNKELFRLMSAMYPDKKGEMEGKDIKELKELLIQYKKQEESGKLTADIPMELHLDVPKENLRELFDQCTYAFLPAYRGATLRNSSMVNAFSNGFIVYSHKSEFTPSCLCSNGEHHGAMVLMESDAYGEDKEGDCDFNGYANEVLIDIARRIQDYKLNQETLNRCKRLTETRLSGEIIFNQFSAVYKMANRVDHPEYSVFMDWQSEYYAKRSYAKFNAVQGIDIKKQSDINFKTLISNLKSFAGSYSLTGLDTELNGLKPSEMNSFKEFLLKELKGKALTPSEKRIFRVLMRSDWFIKHVTPHHAMVRKNGNRLMSLDHRKRRGDNTNNSHTMPTEGNTDNVFMSLCPGSDFETVRFLDKADTEISAKVETLAEEGAAGLKGMWSSGHIYAFINEQEGEPVRLFGTLYRVRYRKKMDGVSGQEEWAKECVFTHPNGTEIVQAVRKQDEIFVYPRIDIAVALMTIEKMRLMGPKAWTALQSADEKTLQDLVQVIFHSGVFEVHKPAQFLLDEPGVAVVKRKPKAHGYDQIDQDIMRPLIEAALSGNVDLVLKSIASSDLPLDTSVYLNGYNLNLMAAAILGGQVPVVTALLELGVNIHSTDTSIFIGKSKGISNCIGAGLFSFVALLSHSEFHRKTIKRILGEKYSDDLKIHNESAMIIANLLISQGSKFKKNKDIIRPVLLSEYELNNILYHLQPQPDLVERLLQAFQGKGEDLPLVEAVCLRSPQLVEHFLKLGAEVDKTSQIDGMKIDKPFYQRSQQFPYSTPLMMALYLDDIDLVKLLIRHNANVNKFYSATPRVLGNYLVPVAKISEYEGYSSLMMGVKRGNLELCRVLLEADADITHRSLQGKTAFSIAKENKRDDILDLLMSHLEPWENDSLTLHKAAASSDWVTCKALMQQNVNDLVLDGAGRSPYDINPGLLKQPFIPKERQIESYQRFIVSTRFIFSFSDESGKRYFLVKKSSGQDDQNDTTEEILPFLIGIGPSHEITSKIIMKMCSALNLARSEKDFVLKRLGTLSTGISEKDVFYADEIAILEFGSEILPTVQAMSAGGWLSLISADQILTCRDKERKTRLERREAELRENVDGDLRRTLSDDMRGNLGEDVYDGVYANLSSLTRRLLQILASQKEISAFSEKELHELNALYNISHVQGHQLFDFANKGDITAIAQLLNEGNISVNTPIPIFEGFQKPYKPTIDKSLARSSKNNEDYTVALQVAFEAGQLDCAYALVDKYDAKVPQHLPENIYDVIIKAGHIGFFRYFCERSDDKSQLKSTISGYIQKIVKYEKLELLNYIMENNLTDDLPEDIICNYARDCLSVEVIKALAPKIKNLKKVQGFFDGAMYFYDVDGNCKGPKGSSTYDHLTQAERNQRIVELFRYTGRVDNTDYRWVVQGWIKTALKKGNLPLIDECLKFQSYSDKDSDMMESTFDELEKELKEKEEKVLSILARFIDPNGRWSLIVSAVHRFMKSTELALDEGVFLEKVESLYQKTAPQLVAFRKALEAGDTKRVSEYLSQGMDVNATLFLRNESLGDKSLGGLLLERQSLKGTSLESVQKTSIATPFTSPFTTPIQIVLKAKQYDCLNILVQAGANIQGITLEDIQEMVRAGQAELLTLLSKKECPMLRKQAYELSELLKLACDTKNWAVLTALLEMDCPSYAFANIFENVVTMCLESNDLRLFRLVLPKVDVQWVRYAYSNLLYNFLVKKGASSAFFPGQSWSIEDKVKLEENSADYYQVAKEILRQKGASSVYFGEFPDHKLGLLHLWGMNHAKDLYELFELMLNAPESIQDRFFSYCFRDAIDNLDQKQMAWLLKHRSSDLKNTSYIYIPDKCANMGYVGSIIDYLINRVLEREEEWKDKGKIILEFAEQLIHPGAYVAHALDFAGAIKNDALRTALIAVLNQKPKVSSGALLTTAFDLQRSAVQQVPLAQQGPAVDQEGTVVQQENLVQQGPAIQRESAAAVSNFDKPSG